MMNMGIVSKKRICQNRVRYSGTVAAVDPCLPSRGFDYALVGTIRALLLRAPCLSGANRLAHALASRGWISREGEDEGQTIEMEREKQFSGLNLHYPNPCPLITALVASSHQSSIECMNPRLEGGRSRSLARNLRGSPIFTNSR